MNLMLCQITENAGFFLQFVPQKQQRTHQSPTLMSLYVGNTLVAGGFPTQRASNAASFSVPWRHYEWNAKNLGYYVIMGWIVHGRCALNICSILFARGFVVFYFVVFILSLQRGLERCFYLLTTNYVYSLIYLHITPYSHQLIVAMQDWGDFPTRGGQIGNTCLEWLQSVSVCTGSWPLTHCPLKNFNKILEKPFSS